MKLDHRLEPVGFPVKVITETNLWNGVPQDVFEVASWNSFPQDISEVNFWRWIKQKIMSVNIVLTTVGLYWS